MQLAAPFDKPSDEYLPILSINVKALSAIILISDCAGFIVSMALSRAAYSGYSNVSQIDLGSGIIAALFFTVTARYCGMYKIGSILAPGRSPAQIAICGAVGVAGVICLLFLLGAGPMLPRGVMLLYFVISPAMLLFQRYALAVFAQRAMERRLISGSRAVVIGEISELERLHPSETLAYGIEEVGRFTISRGRHEDALSGLDRAQVRDAIAYARRARAAEFAILMPWSRDRAMSELANLLRISPLAARVYPDHRARDILAQNALNNADPYFCVEIQREPLSRAERLTKRVFDLVGATAALTLLSPVMMVAAISIKLSSRGPVIFRQRRRGFDSRDFVIWKFRTMRVMEDGPSIVQARRNDDRVTKVGALLRRTSIDELPQLVNVLKGDMSLVGPRPHALAHDDEFGVLIGEYAFRHHVKPGLTGAAQVRGLRGETKSLGDMQKRVQRDLWYINNWSFWLDLRIIAQTFLALTRHEAF